MVWLWRAFPELAKAGRLALRLDTHGGRYVEGLDVQESMPCSNAMRLMRSAAPQ